MSNSRQVEKEVNAVGLAGLPSSSSSGSQPLPCSHMQARSYSSPILSSALEKQALDWLLSDTCWQWWPVHLPRGPFLPFHNYAFPLQLPLFLHPGVCHSGCWEWEQRPTVPWFANSCPGERGKWSQVQEREIWNTDTGTPEHQDTMASGFQSQAMIPH